MKIEKIELNGFKSFSDKTTFNLDNGITCIVGPNGCGKSNILDAFRWVLGEQSAKTLRGSKMEEVIFNGSSVKKPKGMADVTLHISGLDPSTNGNGDKSGNLITVSRRLYRSGESEYLINRHECRLKDIKDLFLDTGLEVKSYSIIEQGHIDAIMNSRPDGRRFLIEEVAGVIKYKVRKAEAQNKLESSRQNLQRISDVISEIKKQINILNRLAKKAERYKTLSEELKTIELKLNKKEYSALKEKLKAAETGYEKARQEESSLRASLSTSEAGHQKDRLDLVTLEKELNALNDDYHEHERIIADLQKKIAILNTEVENTKDYSTRLSEQASELDEMKTGLNSKIALLNDEKQGLNSQFEDFRLSASEKQEFQSGIEHEISDIETGIEEKRKDIFNITETLGSLNNDLTRLHSIIESMSKKEAGYTRELEDITTTAEEIEAEIEKTDSSILSNNNDLMMINEQKEALSHKISETRDGIDRLRNSITSLKEDMAFETSRLESLREISSDGMAADILENAGEFHVAGIVSDIISVDKRYEKPVEAVLSGKINGVILDSFSDIEPAVRHIRENRLSRTALMVSGSNASARISLPSHQSIIGPATEFVSAEENFMPLVRRLLDNVIIVNDLKAAFELIRDNPGLIFVTPGGDVVDAAFTVLSGKGKDILKKKRELRELEDRINERQKTIEQAENELSNLNRALSGYEQEITALKDKLVMLEKDLSIHKTELLNLHNEKERLYRKKATIRIEMEQTRSEKEGILNNMEEIRRGISETASKKEEMEHSLSSLQNMLSEKKEYYEQYRSDLMEIKLRMTSYREKIDSISKEIETVRESISGAERKKENIEAQIQNNRSLIEQKINAIEELDAKLKEHIALIDTLSIDISGKKEEIEDRAEAVSEKEKEIKSTHEEIESITSKLSSLEVAKTEYRLKMENVFNDIVRRYGVNIDQFDGPEPSEEEIEKIESLSDRIQSIGPVNLETIDEYEGLKERYEFLTAQQEDLTKSIEELEEAIRKINMTTRRRLKDAFTSLNERFSEVFADLFGGGKASLILTDEQNILESGIEIVAQPPGKKLQNISLLSGGEKALTAISLIFAGFLIKPAPICILDEADAPLDESNTVKYAAMVRELSRNIQFIVITHNRATMETADNIYGITMEEPGTSKVISMQLTEK